jgi:hypothetical protein
VAGSCEHGNELLCFIEGEEFVGLLGILLASREGFCSVELLND